MTEPQVVRDSAPKQPLVVMEGVNKHFGALHVLKDINLTVGKGEVVILIGPSGSGKSTLCRTINRLETYESGSITPTHAAHGIVAFIASRYFSRRDTRRRLPYSISVKLG